MASIGSINISTKDLTKHLTLEVRVPRMMRLRFRLGALIIGLASRVLGAGCDVQVRDDSARRWENSSDLPDHLTPESVGGLRVVIFLDGVEVPNVVEAHQVDGWLLRLITNHDGRPYIVSGEIATERLIGHVTACAMEPRRGAHSAPTIQSPSTPSETPDTPRGWAKV